MGPRIILRGAIPIDSNIGVSGHRPLLGEVVFRVFSLFFLPFVFSLLFELAVWCLVVGSCWAVLPLEVHGTTAGGARYYRLC